MKTVEVVTAGRVRLSARADDFRALIHIARYPEVPIHGSYERAVLLGPGGLEGLGGEGYEMASVNELVARHLMSSGFAVILPRRREIPERKGTLHYTVLCITALGREFVTAFFDQRSLSAPKGAASPRPARGRTGLRQRIRREGGE